MSEQQVGATAGHTPAPWTASLGRHRADMPAFGFAINAAGKIPPIASAGVATPNHVLVTPGIATGFEAAEVEANARLIASAPELLSVCQALVADEPALVAIWDADDDGKWDALVEQARAAIRKATEPSDE